MWLWKEYATIHQETAQLPFRAWSDNRNFVFGNRDFRHAAVAQSKRYFESVKKQFWEDTSFLHSIRFIPPVQRPKHWPLPNITHTQLKSRSAKAGQKESPFFSVFRQSDLEMLYWIVAANEAVAFICDGAADRGIRVGFPIGFCCGKETEILMLKIADLHVHGYPVDHVDATTPLLSIAQLSLGNSGPALSELRQRCMNFSGGT